MALRAALARQAAKDKTGGISRAPPPLPSIQTAAPPSSKPHSPAPSSGSVATPQDPGSVSKKRKRALIPTPEVVVLPSSQTLGTEALRVGEPSSDRSPTSPPRFPPEYTAETNLFTRGHTHLGFNILHSLGSAAEQRYLEAEKLRPCLLEGCTDVTRGLMRMMHCLDRTANLHSDAVAEAEDACSRIRTLSRELAEFKEVHSATIDSLKGEADRARDEAKEQRHAAETAQAEAKAAKDEAQASREELVAYKSAEVQRHEAFLKSQEFEEILGPKTFKFLKIGFESCRGQFAEAGLLPSDAAPDFPSMDRAIASVPDNVLEDELEETPEIPKETNKEDQAETDAPH